VSRALPVVTQDDYQVDLLADFGGVSVASSATRKGGLRRYQNLMTADVNEKGVLDVDTVKGCTAGMNARPGTGCYGGCYAANIARFRGIDFSVAITREVGSAANARAIERAVKAAPEGFFRIGTMGDPCHAWEHTVKTVEWLAPFAVPVIITKHWCVASDEQLARLVICGTVLNTSVSALDTPQELRHREKQIARYAGLGGVSVARIVSCDFDTSNDEGRAMAEVQARLFTLKPTLDNPLRVPRTHDLVKRGVIRVHPVFDINTIRSISLFNPNTYVGHCSACPDKCGLTSCGPQHPRPEHDQFSLLPGKA
jgi:hypothetical protein